MAGNVGFSSINMVSSANRSVACTDTLAEVAKVCKLPFSSTVKFLSVEVQGGGNPKNVRHASIAPFYSANKSVASTDNVYEAAKVCVSPFSCTVEFGLVGTGRSYGRPKS